MMLNEREREREREGGQKCVDGWDQRKGQEAGLAAGADYSNSVSHKQITIYSSDLDSSSFTTYLEHNLGAHEAFLPHDDHVAIRKADAVLWKCWIFPCLGVA